MSKCVGILRWVLRAVVGSDRPQSQKGTDYDDAAPVNTDRKISFNKGSANYPPNKGSASVADFYKPALGAADIFGPGHSSGPAVCKPPHGVGGATLMKIG